MTEETKSISIQEMAKNHVREILTHRPNSYVYHNFRHTEEVANSVRALAKEYGIETRERQLLTVAAWFHDIAYGDGEAEGHEERGAVLARNFLQEQEVAEKEIQLVERLIRATQVDTVPTDLPEMIIKDADCSHLAKKNFEKHSDRLRMEWELVNGQVFNEADWLKNNIDFLEKQQFYTTIARNVWEKNKQAQLKRLKKQLSQIDIVKSENTEVPANVKNKEIRKYPRGVETMFRVTLRNHIHLSRIADNKANFLLSISAIILSLLLGNLITDNKPVVNMLLPSIYFLLVCIVTMVFAILAARPNITKGKFSREALMNKKVNILFFGNFHSMPLEEFNWGMDQLSKNEDLLYNSLTTDLYFLGKVLHKKYQYLRTAFHVFMFGLITSALFYLVMLIVY